MKKTGTLKRLTALVIAALMILSAVPAVFADAPTDWDGWEDLEISLKWNDAEGNPNAASAKTIQEMPGSYWAKVPEGAPWDGLTLNITYPEHPEWHFKMKTDPVRLDLDFTELGLLDKTTDAGNEVTLQTAYILIQAYRDDSDETVDLRLYLSSVVDIPEAVETPEPIEEPTEEPTPEPTEEPTPEPTEEPTPELTEEPTPEPTEEPTPEPTEEPTPEPTEEPTEAPAAAPTEAPTEAPTAAPTENPTEEPTEAPAETKKTEPTAEPTAEPKSVPKTGNASDLPIGEYINQYGKTNAKVNFREGPGTDTTKKDVLGPGTYIYMISNETGHDNNRWTKVLYNGEEGYVSSGFIDVLGETESEKYNNAQTSPAPVYPTVEPTEEPTAEPTEEPTAEPTEEPTEEPTAAPTAEPTEEPTPTPAPTAVPEKADKLSRGQVLNRYGVTSNKVNFREGPSSSKAKKIINEGIPEGTYVWMIMNEIGPDDGEMWTKVNYNGTEGYVKSEFIYAIDEEAGKAYDAAQISPAPQYDPTPEPTAEPTVEPTAEPTAEPTTEPTDTPEPEVTEEPATKAEKLPVGEYFNRYGVINNASGKKVNMREKPDKGSTQVGQFSNGDSIYVIDNVNGTSDGKIWAHVLVGDQEGYIRGDFVDVLSEKASKDYDSAQSSPAPVYPTPTPVPPTIEPTEEPTVAPTEKPTETPTEKPTETPTEKPTETPTETPTEKPTETPTEKPTETPTEKPTEVPTAAPTETPTAVPTDTPTPTATPEPVQRTGYAVTIGDGVYVRNYPNSSSAIIDELPINKVVYVTGQKYDSETAWHVTQYDGKWGYVRGDMLRMMSEYEVLAYLQEIQKTPEPAATDTPAPFNADSLSCYGYVSADSVNFRKQASTQSERISRLKKYALCLIYDTQTVDNTTWYKVGYEGTIGYVNGDYFKQMTVSEAEKFFNSKEYLEGLNNNTTEQQQQAAATQPKTTGTPSGVVSAEDQKVQTWTNPDSGVSVSYVPFDPFATPEPLPENNVRNKEYLDSLADRIKNGSLKEEDLQKLLETAYRDSTDKDTLIESAMTYVREKLGTENTTEPTATPEDIPLNTEENPQFEQEQNQGGSAIGWIIGGVLLAGAGGGAYYYYSSVQKKRQAAQRLAQKKAAQQRKEQSGAKTTGGTSTGTTAQTQAQTPSAQQAAKVRTNTARQGGANKPYSRNVENPYGRYTSGGEDDASYTASFKPDESKKTGSSPRRRNSGNGEGKA